MNGPVKVAQADINTMSNFISDDGLYNSAYVLLRSGNDMLQMIRAPFKNGLIGREDLLRIGRHRITNKLALKDLQKYTGIPVKEFSYEMPITVVVCTRNRTDMLKDCLIALQQLDYPRYEILIVDNAPDNDETENLVKGYGVRYVRENKPGLDRARNRGIRESLYPIVAFTDDDARPDRNWLKTMAENFSDEQVMAVTGYVAPAELETLSQQMFEWSYGGMGHGFEKRVFKGHQMTERAKLTAGGFGVGANMAFRKSWFDRGGFFDPALDVGTPSSGGGDIEMFHRVVAKGGVLVYDPNMLVWHLHRREMDALHRQILNNGRSFVCYLMTCYRNGTARMGTLLIFFLRDWLYNWHIKNFILGGGKVSRRLLLTEMKGMLTGPGAYFRSRRFVEQSDRE